MRAECNFIFWSAGCSLLRAEGFSCSLDVLYGGLGISKLQFFIKKNKNLFKAVNFFKFLIMKTLYPDWIRIGMLCSVKGCIRIRIQTHWIRIRNTVSNWGKSFCISTVRFLLVYCSYRYLRSITPYIYWIRMISSGPPLRFHFWEHIGGPTAADLQIQIRDPVPFLPVDPKSIFLRAHCQFLCVKSNLNLCQLAQIVFCTCSKKC